MHVMVLCAFFAVFRALQWDAGHAMLKLFSMIC